MKTKNITWKEVYKLPLKYDGFNYAWSENNTMSLMFDSAINEYDCNLIVDCINGVSDKKIEGIRNQTYEFFIHEQYVFCVRGWGYLTGIGGLNLSSQKAVEIQDSFIKYILERLEPLKTGLI